MSEQTFQSADIRIRIELTVEVKKNFDWYYLFVTVINDKLGHYKAVK
jgi:hypothetical protein